MFGAESPSKSRSVRSDAAIDQYLLEWRRRVTLTLSIVCSIAYLPAVLLMVFNQHSLLSWPMRIWMVVRYVMLATGALFTKYNYRVTVWVLVGATYVSAILGAAAHPRHPHFAITPLCMAIVALVLLGERAGRLATIYSAIVVLTTPFITLIFPGLATALSAGAPEPPLPLQARFLQSAVLTADLVCVMVLLDRYHLLLMRVLASRQLAASRLEKEVVERTAAHENLQREVEERRRLEQEIARVSDEERRSLGQDVHDGVCQDLTGALLRCQALKRRIERGQNLATEDLEALSSLLEETIDEAHAVAKGLCPLEPDAEALSPALRALAKRTQASTGVECRFVANGDVSVPDSSMAHHIYRIAQEALSNASRHSNAKRILVELQKSDNELLLRIEDDGTGMPPKSPSDGMGLSTMTYRAQIIEGELIVGPGADGGTSVLCRVPLTGHGAHQAHDGDKET